MLAEYYDVDTDVIQWFAFTHDLARVDEYTDIGHGARAAALLPSLNDQFMGLSPLQMQLLETACRGHSDGARIADPTVMVCWDADRLDLARVGIEPNPQKLCTAYARRPDVIKAAINRSVASALEAKKAPDAPEVPYFRGNCLVHCAAEFLMFQSLA